MTIYYVKQDNTIWGCGEADCCGEYEEEIDRTFVDCNCEIPEAQMTGDHLQSCVGGGPVLKWRKANKLEVYAFNSGKDEGFQEGSDWGIEWQKNAESKLFKTKRDKTIHELVHEGYTITVQNDGTKETYYAEEV
jgi:hypothetical protein